VVKLKLAAAPVEPLAKVTLSDELGIPFGLQFVAVFHEVSVKPTHV
jgi:hypothetical protein